MHKIIKKTLPFIIVPGAVIVLLPFVLFLLFRIPSVQTYIVKGVTKYISSELKTSIRIGSIEFTYFNMLVINNILIKDQNNDTLFYSPRITAGIRRLEPSIGVIHLGRVSVSKPVIALITDSSGVMNLNWYLDKLSSSGGDTTKKGNTFFRINRIDIDDGRFALIDLKGGSAELPIDFSKLRIRGIKGSVENLTVLNDSTTLSIHNLTFNESNGFAVKSFSGNLLLEKQNIVFRKVSLICDSSIINSDHIGIYADSAASFSRFLQEVRLDINIQKSSINSSDIQYFVPFFKGYNESFWLSGNVSGTVSELKGRNIRMSYKDETSFDCDFDFSGLPDIDNTFIFLEINDFRSTSKDIEQINIPGKGNILLPEVMRKLGVVSFSGNFTGFTTDFVTYCKINTNKGLISTDISLRPEKGKKFRIKGLIKGTDIDLGSITGNSDLIGKMTMESNVDGYTNAFKSISVNLAGKVDSVEINDYKYRNIALNGSFNDKAWDGSIRINDKNIVMEFLGMFDFRKKLPEFDFTLNLKKANLCRLNIDKSDTTSAASLLLTANFTGNNIDNLDGEIRLLNSNFRKYGTNLEVYDFSLKTFIENSKPAISLRTDFIDASLYGVYNFSGLLKVVKNCMAVMVPSKYEKQKTGIRKGENDFIFEIKLKETDRLNKFLRTGLAISKNSIITGTIRPDSIMEISGNSKMFAIGNTTFNDLSINARFKDTVLNAGLESKSFDLSGLANMKDMNLDIDARPNHFNLGIFWDNKEKILSKGSFEASGVFTGIPGDRRKAVLNISLQPGEIYLSNRLWKIEPSEISIDSSSIKFDRFNVSNNENYVMIDGALSEDPADTINMKFNGIDLNPINSFYEKKMGNTPGMMRLDIGGTLNGKISLTNIYHNFMFESDLRLKSFTLLSSQYGEIKILSGWNNVKKVVDINASNNFEGARMFNVYGYYDPQTTKVDLLADADKLPVDALNTLLNSFASGINGKASGRVNLSGELSKLFLTGSLLVENGTMKIDYIQSKYNFTDSVRFDRSGIKFNNIQIRDDRGNSAFLNGAVYHKYFQDFNVDISLKMNDCMVLNTKSKDNENFYGTAYGSGVTTIKSIGPLLKFDISGKTGKNSKFFIPLNNGLSVSQSSFISFVNPDSTGNKEESRMASQSSTQMEIGLDLNVTPDAEVQLIMDPKIGDIMKGTGNGNLNISLDRKGILKLFGDYTIENGSYLFTLGNIINKSFDVESGGKISFNGDLDNADIDIKAIYRTKASLSEINPDLFTSNKQKERIPVECHLLLTGRLLNPVVGFDIYLPTADEETRAYLKSMIKSEEDMSRQFLFLLVMGSFYADQSSVSQPNIGSSVAGLTTMEMLSNQLSNWLSQISKDFDIGVAYRPGSTNLSNQQELKVALSTQLLNDRVIINGNFDVAGMPGSSAGQTSPGTNTITGAFDIEYKINEKIRFKVFNRSNDNFYIDNGIQYTQGLGIFYREDFNKLKDLLKKKDKGDMKKEEETKPEKK